MEKVDQMLRPDRSLHTKKADWELRPNRSSNLRAYWATSRLGPYKYPSAQSIPTTPSSDQSLHWYSDIELHKVIFLRVNNVFHPCKIFGLNCIFADVARWLCTYAYVAR